MTDKLKKLSRTEKLELIQLLEEKKKRERDKRDLYQPHAGQLTVHKSEKLSRFVFSGNGYGKTTLGVNETLWAVQGYNPITKKHTPFPCRAYVILDSPNKIENIIIPEIRKWYNLKEEQLHKGGKPYISKITFNNGSVIKFIFWEQNPMTAEGLQGDWFWFDEPAPRPLFTALYRGGREKGRTGRHLLTGTPLAAPWLRTDIYEPWTKGQLPDVECFRGHTEQNLQNLDEKWYESFQKLLTDKEKGIRLRGEFFDLEGLALSHLFRRDTHTIPRSELKWDKNNPCVIAVDPHPSKAHHAVLLGVDRDNRLYVLEEYKEKAIARKFAQSLIDKEWFSKYRVLDIVYDSLGSSETTSGEGFRTFGEVINEVLSVNKVGRARATTFDDKSDEAFIERIQDALAMPTEPDNFGQKIPKLRVISDCNGSIGDIENVQWAKYKNLDMNKPSLDISNTDFLSCIKYALACNLFYKKGKDAVYYANKPKYGFKLGPHAKIKSARLR